MNVEFAKLIDLNKITKIDKHIKTENLKELIEKEQVYILKEKDEIKGVLRYSLFWLKHPFLDLILLAPEVRNKGFGTLMMDKWEKAMKLKGYKYVITSTQADESAWSFYEKRGYLNKGGFFPPMQEVKELIYIKEL